MAKVNPPPIAKRPPEFVNDRGGKDAYFRQLEWIVYQLWVRTGAGDDTVNSTANQQIDTDSLYSLFSAFQDIESDLDDLSNQTVIPNDRHVAVVTSNYSVSNDDVVICNNTSRITITLPANPDDQQLVAVKRASFEIIIDGNGKTIDGSDTITVNRKYTTLDIIYTVETDSWHII